MGREACWTLMVVLLSRLPAQVEGCFGRKVLTNRTGIISDGDTDYKSYARCEWLIDARSPNKSIVLEFEFLNTECSYDFLFLFDGNSYNAPMLASLSGHNQPDPIVARSGQMLVYLFSDRNYERKGFKARYSIQLCPHNCSNQGNCVDHSCVCFPSYTGEACEIEQCPNDCGEHGQCITAADNVTSYCQCMKGYSGYMCNITLNDAVGTEYWYEMSPSGLGLSSRTAHAGAWLPQSSCLYIFGGFTLNSILSDLMRFCVETNRWENIPETSPWPRGRYEHAIAQFGYGFYMFGGILGTEAYSNELWYFNASSESWELQAQNSTVKPLEVSGHTLTLAEDWLYVFGGKSVDGRFWCSMYRINASDPSQWEEVFPLGGKASERRLVGHSTVYHKESKSLLIYGGYSYSPDQPKFGFHMNNLHMFHTVNRVWSQLKYNKSDDYTDVPSERSFHSAQIMGNYMVIYGGNTHVHHNLELCYDYAIYLYHLGCHTWVKVKFLMGKYSTYRLQMKQHGRVSHVAVSAYGNTLLVAGGYSGYVRGDLIAFKFPPYIAPPSSEALLDLDYCVNYTTKYQCGHNPDCFYCHNITTTNTEGCIHRSQHQLCGKTPNTHNSHMSYLQVECPGICGTLTTCLECLSQGQGATLTDNSPQRWTHIQPCNWCVKEAKCQLRSKPMGTCADSNNTFSGIPGWWGGTSASLNLIDQCRLEDFPAGLQAVKHRPSFDFSHPDEVHIIRSTAESEEFRNIYAHKNPDHILWMGYIHPLNAIVSVPVNNSIIYTLTMIAENISFVVRLSRDSNASNAEIVADVAKQHSSKDIGREIMKRLDGSRLFPNKTRGNKYFVAVNGTYQYERGDLTTHARTHDYRMELKWDGRSPYVNPKKRNNLFSYEFLEPRSEGNCRPHHNCLACMLDNKCGWCAPENACVLRNETNNTRLCSGEDKQKILISEPSMCPVCSDYIECHTCTEDPLCEWVKSQVVCVRRGRWSYDAAYRHPDECPAICHERNSCSSCLNISLCAWCENLRTCLPFSDYVTRYRLGQCTEWIDNEVTLSENNYTCRNCSAMLTCKQCLDSFSCGWCGNNENPTKGVCFEGDFAGPYGNSTCSAIVNSAYPNISVDTAADWSYSTCPDVEECRLGLAKCHPNATCTNTPTAYNCTCNRGYKGDGAFSCDRTCYYKCAHGECIQEDGQYICDCDLGWTGIDCGTDCKCNGHSMCENGTGKCDFCINNTTGPFCNFCLTGFYGDPKDTRGCSPCECNKHGDPERNLCDDTGQCYCVDHTTGVNCDKCQDGYYGDPRGGGKCYLSCDHGVNLPEVTKGSVGSHKGPGVSSWRSYCLWMLAATRYDSQPWGLPTITFGIEDLAVECERDHVYVYDGVPAFIDSKGDGFLLGAFCGFYTGKFNTVVARKGVITIFFDADISGNFSSTRGFNGSYYVNKCVDPCDETNNQLCQDGACVCKDGYSGFPDCVEKSCKENCRYRKASDSCMCEAGFGGASYFIGTYPWDANPLQTDFHGGGPISRYGHVLIHCGDDIVYLFGGRSLKYGLLNDIWQYNFTTRTWTEIKPLKGDQPSPRYYHAGVCVRIMKHLYVFGGLVSPNDGHLDYVASKQMWKFAIGTKKWTGPIEPDWMKGFAGHSMTVVRETKIIIIGGFSTDKYFSDTVYVYDANSFITSWDPHTIGNVTGAQPVGIYGHTAVYNAPSNTIYVFGGHVFKDEILRVSNHLFTYNVTANTWDVLHPEPGSQVESRYFHTAVGFDDYMVVLGGYSNHKKTPDHLLVYKYTCNFWSVVDLSVTSMGRTMGSLVSAQAVKYRNSMFVHGGVSGVDHSEIYELQLPADICTLLSSKEPCREQPGCSVGIVGDKSGNNASHCYSANRTLSVRQGEFIAEFQGQLCNLKWYESRNCSNITNCSECVAVNPQFKDAEPSCFWCGSCSPGKCIPRGYVCDASNNCRIQKYLSQYTQTKPGKNCPISTCEAATCERCDQLGGVWSQHFGKIITGNGGVYRQNSLEPIYDWSCRLENVAKRLREYKVHMSPPMPCPKPCYDHRTCTSCLASRGGEGGSQECYWSVTLGECLPPAYLSLHCTGGSCGTVLQGQPDKCPAPCMSHVKCADCLKAQGCGWCAYGLKNGQGTCMPGTLSGPKDEELCDSKNIAFGEKTGISEGQWVKHPPNWAYDKCPAENECTNNHHDCDVQSENCQDNLEGFTCTCKTGYRIEVKESGKPVCTPVCHQGCIHGSCVEPDRCECKFGYVGTNCSDKCECNGHSQCKNVVKKDVCLECKNNTQGKYCQECKPWFVGNARNGGRCVPCMEFCNGHSEICLDRTDSGQTYSNINHEVFLSRLRSDKKPQKGAEHWNETVCMYCQHNTHNTKRNNRCEECKSGYFRLKHMSRQEPCMKCMCNGHSDTCDANSGLNCDCQNNTKETRCSTEEKNDIKCHKLQCAECAEYFLGTPTDGRHCYRTMTLNKDYCFDPITQAECTRSPTSLKPGRSVFFAVQPKYVNVDIRVTIDVTVGGIDVFFSPQDHTFIVDIDKKTHVHTVHVDRGINRVTPAARVRRSSPDDVTTGLQYNIREIQAKGINTFITVKDSDSILIIRNVRSRLVITLPNDKLNLKKSRFYMIFLNSGAGRQNDTMGNLYFRQDQPHIDLFVFFSVFFSCFFLFLAMCVLLWKTKQGLDARRTRQQRAKEMLHMASRPFAKALVLIEHNMKPYNILPNVRYRGRKPTERTQLLPSEALLTSPTRPHESLNVIPIAIEPMDDGIAALGTFMFQLPGGAAVPSHLCIGSTLTKGLQVNRPITGKLRRTPTSSSC